MTMKQTQTKLFAFSDAGLDLASVSRAKIPLAFKKVLNTGYNEQTVSSVSVSGNQVIFTYGGAHGYNEKRVLKVSSGLLSEINNGEFVIDSVTSNSVTLTIDGAPVGVMGGFETKVAPLGWDLVYELDLVQLYKMRYLDERELYIRFVFAPATGTHKSSANVCVGKTADEVTGVITDPNAITEGKENITPVTGFQWMFSYITSASEANYTAAQGLNNYGNFFIIGSMYHLACMCNGFSSNYPGRFFAILPTHLYSYDVLDYPLNMGMRSTTAMSTSNGNDYQQFNPQSTVGYSHCYVGNIPVALDNTTSSTSTEVIDSMTSAVSSFFPSNIDQFNTFAAMPITIYDRVNRQFLGFVSGGAYRSEIFAANLGSIIASALPKSTEDENSVFIPYQVVWVNQNNSYIHSFCAPLEEIKIES